MNEMDVLRMVVSLTFIVALILAGAWLMRRAGWLRPAAGQPIKVLGSQSLGARSSVAIIQIDDTQLVLGVTPQQITLLHASPASSSELQPDSSPVTQPGFSQSLRSALARHRNNADALQP